MRVSGGEVAEERQPHAEAGVLARGVAGRLLQQLEERPLTLGGDAVDGLAAAAGGLAGDRRHEAVALHATQGRVERAVGDPPETAQGLTELPGGW